MTNEHKTNEQSTFELILQQAEKGNRILAEGLFEELHEDAKDNLRIWIVQIYAVRSDWPEETLNAIQWLSNIAELWYMLNYYNNL